MDEQQTRAHALLGRVTDAEVAEVVRALLVALAQADAARDSLEQRLSAQRELLEMIAYPILRVRADTLCVPLVGPVDADRTTALTEALLAAVVRHRARFVILDMSGAVVYDPQAVGYLDQIFGAIRLLGARGVVCGMSPATANLLTDGGNELRGVPAHGDLAGALAATERRG